MTAGKQSRQETSSSVSEGLKSRSRRSKDLDALAGERGAVMAVMVVIENTM